MTATPSIRLNNANHPDLGGDINAAAQCLLSEETNMTIYVVTSRSFPDDLVEVTDRDTSAAIWREDAATWVVTEEPDATPDELAEVARIEAWLYDNYNAGAHWIVETTEPCRHVIELRRQTPGQYRVALERHWRTMDDYAADIRAA